MDRLSEYDQGVGGGSFAVVRRKVLALGLARLHEERGTQGQAEWKPLVAVLRVE